MEQESRVHSFQFTGSGSEYFRIWIVNLALSVVTLGIYSAWAKVRRKRYFNQHSYLDGHNFDYVADPIKILKGRLIAGALFLVYVLSGRTMPILAQFMMLALFFALPWIVTRSLQFNAYYTRYRGLHFHFLGTVGEAVKVYVLWGVASVLSLGLALPYAFYRRTAFYAGNHAFGSSRTEFSARPLTYYKIGLVALALLAVPGIALLAGTAGVAAAKAQNDMEMLKRAVPWFLLGLVAFYLMLPAVIGYVRARVAGAMFNGTRLGELDIASRHGARRLMWIYFSNLMLILFTVGLYTPWAQVRLARYWVDHLDVIGPADGLGNFVAASGEEVNATGMEMADVFDIDVALT